MAEWEDKVEDDGTKAKSFTLLLYERENSLIISALFFDAFTGELISLITHVNSKCSPPPLFLINLPGEPYL